LKPELRRYIGNTVNNDTGEAGYCWRLGGISRGITKIRVFGEVL